MDLRLVHYQVTPCWERTAIPRDISWWSTKTPKKAQTEHNFFISRYKTSLSGETSQKHLQLTVHHVTLFALLLVATLSKPPFHKLRPLPPLSLWVLEGGGGDLSSGVSTNCWYSWDWGRMKRAQPWQWSSFQARIKASGGEAGVLMDKLLQNTLSQTSLLMKGTRNWVGRGLSSCCAMSFLRTPSS